MIALHLERSPSACHAFLDGEGNRLLGDILEADAVAISHNDAAVVGRGTVMGPFPDNRRRGAGRFFIDQACPTDPVVRIIHRGFQMLARLPAVEPHDPLVDRVVLVDVFVDLLGTLQHGLLHVLHRLHIGIDLRLRGFAPHQKIEVRLHRPGHHGRPELRTLGEAHDVHLLLDGERFLGTRIRHLVPVHHERPVECACSVQIVLLTLSRGGVNDRVCKGFPGNHLIRLVKIRGQRLRFAIHVDGVLGR